MTIDLLNASAEVNVDQEYEQTSTEVFHEAAFATASLGLNEICSGYNEYKARTANRRAHSLNGNTTQSDLSVSSAPSQSLTNTYDWRSVENTPTITDQLETASIGNSYMNHRMKVLTSMNAYGAIQGMRRQQFSKNATISRVIRTTTLPVNATGSSVSTPVSPLTARAMAINGNPIAPVTFPRPTYTVQRLNGIGYALEPSAYSLELIDKANTQGYSARISSVHTDTFFNYNDEVAKARDTIGCERFNPEMIAAKAYIDLSRMTVYQPDAQISDSYVGACSPLLTSWSLGNSFVNDRSLWPANEQYGYNVGTNVQITATAVCGIEAEFSLHTCETTAIGNRGSPNSAVTIPFQLSLRLLNSLGPNNSGKVLAIICTLLAPGPIVPIGYINSDGTVVYTHNLEGINTPGLIEIRFVLPSNPRSDGKVPGNVIAADAQAYLTPSFGPCPTSNGQNFWQLSVPPTPWSPTGANEAMHYVGYSDVNNSRVYSVTALWASFMNSNDPITLQDYMRVIAAIEPTVPMLNCMKFIAQHLDLQAWQVKALQLNTTPVYPTLLADTSRVRYDNTFIAAGTPSLSLYDTLAKSLSRLLSGHVKVANPKERWAESRADPSLGSGTGAIFDGPIEFSNQFYPMFGWATFMAHACASQMAYYICGRSGNELNTAAGSYTGVNPKVIAFAKTLDQTMLGIDAGVGSATQRVLQVCYAAATNGARCPTDPAGLTTFGRRYIAWGVNAPFANPTFIPGTLSISDLFFWLGRYMREWANFPVADILIKSIYLPMGSEISILQCPARQVGANNAAFVYRKQIVTNLQTYAVMDAEPWTDGTDMYNIDLWSTQYPANTLQTITNMTGAIATNQLWLYSAPFTTELGGVVSSVEAKALWPRMVGNQYVVVVAQAQPNNDFTIISDYSQQINQPRATWQFTPPAYRPSQVFVVGSGNPSYMERIANRASAPSSNVAGVTDRADPLGGMAASIGSANLAITGTSEPIGVMQITDTVTNSNAVPSGSGGTETSVGQHGNSTIDGREH